MIVDLRRGNLHSYPIYSRGAVTFGPVTWVEPPAASMVNITAGYADEHIVQDVVVSEHVQQTTRVAEHVAQTVTLEG